MQATVKRAYTWFFNIKFLPLILRFIIFCYEKMQFKSPFSLPFWEGGQDV